MQVVMSNPGLHLAVIGNPGPRTSRRSVTTRSRRKGKTMAFTKKQAQALSKAFRAQGRPVPAKVRRRAGGRSKASYRRARRRAIPARRRAAAARYRRHMPGIKVTTRMRAGKRKTNRKFGKRYGVKTGRRGTIGFRTGRGRGRKTTKLVATNPRRRRARRSTRRIVRRNPSLAGWQRGITAMPQRVPALFRGKDMVPNLLYATGGAASGLVIGGIARGTIMGTLSRVAPGIMGNRLVEGAVGGAITYTGGYLAGTMLIKSERRRTAFITGSAAAALINAFMPGAVNNLLVSIPVIGPMLSRMPGMLGAYVSAPGYQGVGAYVSAPSYQGIGYADDALAAYQDDALAGDLGAYVSAPGYQGVGMFAQSHLDQ